MDAHERVQEWIHSTFDTKDVTVQHDDSLPYGQRVLSERDDDYAIVFFDESSDQVLCSFKELNHLYFRVDPIVEFAERHCQ
ncbi:hypothetical protein [Pseudalkalibacillus hwajinpoensis]|uniref:Uncharacterized protein n=1 Tax=Guptibacillus hwajinpoensis TaxID=208199 RepID=A0A4U1MP05_9BACL|nr:hypothetical protein [Pseudalkalibacillus hwajinpoensis]TKD72240.1 hypothetical protein FBF83_05455 [Pseudalkalibacillus hwajinpoensis]